MIPDVEIHDFFAQLIRDAGLLVYGRTTYELMVPFWPDIAKNPTGQTTSTIEFARAFDSAEKVVFSRSLSKVEDKNSRIVRGRPEDEIPKLKQEQSKNILLGGVTFPSQLIELGLVDEYIFVIQPVLVGEGTRLLKGISLPDRFQLKLAGTKILRSGHVVLHYLKP
jgi:dihydrofolate reductase